MSEEYKKYVLDAMSRMDGDDLERATARFKNLSEEQLDEQYGQSGRTCRQIWQEYKDHREKHNKITEWLLTKI